MKYRIGNLVLIKNINYIIQTLNVDSSIMTYLRKKQKNKLAVLPRPFDTYDLNGTLGLITRVLESKKLYKAKDKPSKEDNGYCLLSQVDSKEYYFYEDQLQLEILS